MDDLPEWLERAILVSCREWIDSDAGFPEGGSGPGLAYMKDDLEAAYRAGYLKRRDEE